MAKTMPGLAETLTQETLERLAGGPYYKRGYDYFKSGCVLSLTEYQGTLSARVQGTHTYRVKLRALNGRLDYACSCPLGDEGAFCKHCVAAGLAWLEGRKSGGGPAGSGASEMETLKAWLLAQPPEALAEIIMEQALNHESLRRGLLRQAEKAAKAEKATKRSGKKKFDPEEWRAAIDNVIELAESSADDGEPYYDDRYDEYDEDDDDDYDEDDRAELEKAAAEAQEELERDLKRAIGEGHATEVMELAEYGLEATERAQENSYDESGDYLAELIHAFEELHLAACRKAKPEPEALARRLYEHYMRSDWGGFADALETYGALLGKKGKAAYQALARRDWEALPARTERQGARSADWRSDAEPRRYRLTRLMERMAEAAGDLDALVAVKSKDLAEPYQYLAIAELYREAKQYDQALEWAKKGLAAFPQTPDWRLREFLADEYHRSKRHEEAMALVWTEFSEHPFLERYKALKSHAEKARAWPAWRERALGLVRERIEREKAQRGGKKANLWAPPPPDHSALVEFLLWEGDVEAAWNEAVEGGCRDRLWMELAKKREELHPKDALRVYQEQIEPVLDQKNNGAYAEAVQLLKKIKELMARTGKSEAFAGYLQRIRAEHKPKRNFIKLLDAARW